MFTAGLGEQHLFRTQTLASSTPEGLTVPARVPGVGQAWGSRLFPPSPPLPVSFPGSGEGLVGALSPAPANPASGQRSSRARWSPLLWRPPLPDRPCLTQGGFSPGLGGGRDVKQAFP